MRLVAALAALGLGLAAAASSAQSPGDPAAGEDNRGADQDHRRAMAFAPRRVERLRQAALEGQAIGQAGQAIVIGEMLHQGTGAFQLGDGQPVAREPFVAAVGQPA